ACGGSGPEADRVRRRECAIPKGTGPPGRRAGRPRRIRRRPRAREGQAERRPDRCGAGGIGARRTCHRRGESAASGSGPQAGGAESLLCDRAGAAQGRRLTAQRRAGPDRRPGALAARHRPARRRLGRRQLQGGPTRRDARGPAHHCAPGYLRPARVSRPCREHRGSDRRALRLAASRQRDGKLREGRTARPGAHPPRRLRRSRAAPGHERGRHRPHEGLMSAEATVLRGSKPLITAGAMIAGLMAFLDSSIVNVALNDIRANFGTPLDQIAWVSTAYAMANITIIPISGWLLRRFGFRRYYAASILIFTAASALCGLAWNLPSLVGFRILQGLGGGATIPTSQSVLFSRYPEKQHGMAGALFAMGAITGPLLGPTVGGYLVEWSSWHWIFFINVPLGLIAAWIAWTQIEQPAFVSDRSPVDRFGIALLAVGMVSLQYVLEEGNRNDWFEDRTIFILAIVAAIALVGFVTHEPMAHRASDRGSDHGPGRLSALRPRHRHRVWLHSAHGAGSRLAAPRTAARRHSPLQPHARARRLDRDGMDEHHALPAGEAELHLHHQPRGRVRLARRRAEDAARARSRGPALRSPRRGARRAEPAHRRAGPAAGVQQQLPLAGVRVSRREPGDRVHAASAARRSRERRTALSELPVPARRDRDRMAGLLTKGGTMRSFRTGQFVAAAL